MCVLSRMHPSRMHTNQSIAIPKPNAGESAVLRGVVRCEVSKCQARATEFLIKTMSCWEFCFRRANLVLAYELYCKKKKKKKNRICNDTATIPDWKIKTHVMMAAPKMHHCQEAIHDPFFREDLFFKPTFFLCLRVAHKTLKFHLILYTYFCSFLMPSFCSSSSGSCGLGAPQSRRQRSGWEPGARLQVPHS